MKNSDMPAMPISEEETDRVDAGITIYTGLTKREYMAGLAMQSMLTNAGRNGYQFDKPENLVGDAVNIADTLLARLRRE